MDLPEHLDNRASEERREPLAQKDHVVCPDLLADLDQGATEDHLDQLDHLE